jgi:sulfopyruvate decarboxylase subunit alpha
MEETEIMTGDELCTLLKSLGYDFFTGVPDSTLSSVFRALTTSEGDCYFPSVREDAAIGLAVGAYLGGRSPAVLMQNSGLGLSVNALASLASLYRIPLLLLIGWRGADRSDAPEHTLMGKVSPRLLQTLEIPFWTPSSEEIFSAVTEASSLTKQRQIPVALLLRDKVIS